MEQTEHPYQLTRTGRKELKRMRACNEEVRMRYTFRIVDLLGQKPYTGPDLLSQLREMGCYTPPSGMRELEADLKRLRHSGWVELG